MVSPFSHRSRSGRKRTWALPKAFQAYEKRAQEEQQVKKSDPKTVQERLRMFTDFVERCQAEKKRRGLGDTEMLHAID